MAMPQLTGPTTNPAFARSANAGSVREPSSRTSTYRAEYPRGSGALPTSGRLSSTTAPGHRACTAALKSVPSTTPTEIGPPSPTTTTLRPSVIIHTPTGNDRASPGPSMTTISPIALTQCADSRDSIVLVPSCVGVIDHRVIVTLDVSGITRVKPVPSEHK